MGTYIDELRRLARLESFDASLFAPCSNDEKELCGLVLSFAVAYNDLKDIAMALRFLKAVDPQVKLGISPERGQHAGLGIHLMRVEAGTIKELMVLIESNKGVISSAAFSGLIRKLSPRARSAWKAIVSIALQKSTDHPMGKFLLFIRNKVAFHYDPKEISRGYSVAFPSDEADVIPYISRGNSMPETRFYFADKAVQEYFLAGVDQRTAAEFMSGRSQIFDDVNIALYEIITKFVNDRGYSWRNVNRIT